MRGARCAAAGDDLRGIAHITGGGLPGNVPRALPDGLGRAARPGALADALGDAAVGRARRARGGRAAGDVQRRDRHGRRRRAGGRAGARGRARRTAGIARRRGVPADELGGARYVEGPLQAAAADAHERSRSPSASRAPAATCGRSSPRAARASSGGEVALVFADRDCPALALGGGAGDRHRASCLGPRRRRGRRVLRRTSARRDAARRRSTSSCSPGYMRLVGPAVLAAFAGRILNIHPSLLPAFPGAHAGARRARRRRRRSPAAPSTSSTRRSTAARSSPRRPCRSLPGDDEASLHERIKAVEHRLLPRAVALLLAGRLASTAGRPASTSRSRRRAAGAAPGAAVGERQDRAGRARARASSTSASSSSPPAGRRGRCARPACRSPTSSAVTGFAGDARRPREDAPSRDPRRHPRRPPPRGAPEALAGGRDRAVRARRRQPLPVRGGRGARRASTFDELVEEIDIGGPDAGPGGGEEPRLRRRRDLARRGTPRCSTRSTRRASVPLGASRGARRRGVPPHRGVRRPDRRGAAVPDGRRPGVELPAGARPARAPRTRTRPCYVCRSRRSRRCATARTRTSRRRATGAPTGAAPGRRPVRDGRAAAPGQGAVATTTSSTRRRPRRSRATAPRPGLRHRQAHQPVRRRRAPDAARGVGGRARRRPGDRVRRASWR